MASGWTKRILDAPRVAPGEDGLKPALDALGGEIVKLRSRDGLRLSGRWLPADPGPLPPEPGPTAGGAASAAASPSPTNVPTRSAKRVNSVGITYFVEGLAPIALRASRYWRAIVFSSIPDAAP